MVARKNEMVEISGPDCLTIYVPKKEWDGWIGSHDEKTQRALKTYHPPNKQ